MTKTVPNDQDNREFAPHPKGPVLARCIHVLDLGERVDDYKGVVRLKPGVQFLFYTGVMKENGEPFILASREFNNTMGEKANLRKFLEAWRGAAYTDAQVKKPIDLDRLIGQPCQLTIDHGLSKKNRTFANVVSIGPVLPMVADKVPAMPDPIPPVPQYLLDRIANYAVEAREYRERIGVPVPGEDHSPAADDDDLPF